MAEKKKKTTGFTAEEKEAMRERLKEMKAAGGKEEDEKIVLEKIAAMSEPDRAMAERIHTLIKASAPELSAKSWYGMPAWAKDGKVVCFFQSGQKFKTRYSTFGFQDAATLDEGNMWPTGFALKDLTATEEKKIAELLKRAIR
jgi:uncharacterized protein YdhG (YjbR/CyaY superfamily)